MSNRSRLGSREEYSHYKANKHLERAASLLNQQSFGMKVPGLFKREIDRTRKQQVDTLNTTVERIDAENKDFSTKNKSLIDANKGLEGNVAYSLTTIKTLQKENEKLMTKIKELEQERDKFEETVRQKYKKDFQEKQKELNKQLEKLKEELEKIARTKESTELYTVRRIVDESPKEKWLKHHHPEEGERSRYKLTISTMMNPKEVQLYEYKTDRQLDDNASKFLEEKIKEVTGKTVDWSELKKALSSNGSVFTISESKARANVSVQDMTPDERLGYEAADEVNKKMEERRKAEKEARSERFRLYNATD